MKRISILTSLLLLSACNSPMQQVVKDVLKSPVASSLPSTASSVKPSVVGSSIVSANPSANIQQGEGGQTAIKPTPVPVEDDRSSSGSSPEAVRTPPPGFGPTPPITSITHVDDLRTPDDQPEAENRPVQEGILSGSVGLTFKDIYKVRYDKEKKEFFSRTGEDVTSINTLMKEYKGYEVWWLNMSEEEAEIRENKSQSNESSKDISNYLSIYIFKIENVNAKEFIEKLRMEKVVRFSNLLGGNAPG